MLVNQSFAVPVRPVNSASVVPREHPFFDPGASTSVMSSEGTGDVATQLTATQPPLGVPGTEAVRDGVESATHPVQGPGTSAVLATQHFYTQLLSLRNYFLYLNIIWTFI